MIMLGTGLGAVDSSIANGANSRDKLRTAITQPVVLVNGKVRFRGRINPVLLTRLLRAEGNQKA